MDPLEKISIHLEFLGYEVEKKENPDGKKLIFAKSTTFNSWLFYEISPNFIGVKANLTTSKSCSHEMLNYINIVAHGLSILRVYITTEDDNSTTITFEATYLGEYEKELFGQFYKMIEHEMNLFPTLENFDTIFIE